MNGLLGRVTFRPGRPDSLRLHGAQGWLDRLAEGRPADELPALMAGVHSLCSHGHRLAAKLAVQAACGERASPSTMEREVLALAVARDHLLRLAQDWPHLLPRGGGRSLPLSGCPAWQSGLGDAERLARLPAWLEQGWLDQPAPMLLAALAADPASAAMHWARRAGTPLASLLMRELPSALALRTAHRPLSPHAAGAVCVTMAPDTGPWARAHDNGASPAHNAGMRLIARLTDLLRLAAPGGTQWLLAGSRTLGEGRGEALVEVGRGLLRYEVSLDAAQGSVTVRSLRVTSPTDRNLHPSGVLAQALREVDDAGSATRLAVAFDPCLPFDIETAEAACA